MDSSNFYSSFPNFTPANIDVAPEEVFVFDSNLEGHHGGGAARTAVSFAPEQVSALARNGCPH